MSEFKNMKISIENNAHLKEVCDVLDSMGYVEHRALDGCRTLCTYDDGTYITYRMSADKKYLDLPITTLPDLIKMRDEFKAESKEG
ncbi:hypothetical protein ABFO76_03610 [Acinetobacter baumannii]